MSSGDQLDQVSLTMDRPLGDEGTSDEHHKKEGQAAGTRSKTEIISALNFSYDELKVGAEQLTSEFVGRATREELATKRSELSTAERIYRTDIEELEAKPDLTETTKQQMATHKGAFERLIKQINARFASSRFARATAKMGELDPLIKKVEAGREGITGDYLLVATPESLELSSRNHTEAYQQYVTAFSAIPVTDLTTDEINNLTAQKLRVDRIHDSIKGFFSDEIAKKKGTHGQDTVDPKQSNAELTKGEKGESSKEDDGPTVGSKSHRRGSIQGGEAVVETEEEFIQSHHLVPQSKVDDLTQQLATVKEQAAEQIKSLEEKLGAKRKQTVRQDSEFSELWYEDAPVEGSMQQGERAIVQLKLDAIQLPYFNGDLITWEAFRDLFEQLVDRSPKLSPTVKFHQLRSHLKGVAFDTIRGYQLTGSNYAAAWSDIKKRFDRKEDLVEEYIRKFLDMPGIQHKANFMNLRHIIDTTNQMLRALPNLDVEVGQWDPFVEHVVSRKLDEETRHEWKQKKGPHAKPDIKDTLGWLETRAFELQPTSVDKQRRLFKAEERPPRHPKHQTKRVFQVNEKKAQPQKDAEKPKKCLICGGPHKIRECTKFQNECAKARTEIVKSLKLCFKCLLKHQLGICDQEDCNYCGGPHNVMLCYKKESDCRSAAPQNDDNDWRRDRPSASKNYKN